MSWPLCRLPVSFFFLLFFLLSLLLQKLASRSLYNWDLPYHVSQRGYLLALASMSLSRKYFSNCSRQTLNPFYLTGTRRWWLRFNNIEKNKIFSVLGTIVNCLWWWGSSSGDVEIVEYAFITITPMSTLTQSVGTCQVPFMGQTVLLENYFLLDRGVCRNKENS